MNGADLLCACLIRLGARVVFGVPGTQNVDLFEAFRRSKLRTVLASHELAASFMANGYARATGEPGILVTIPGPGFTYALTGLAEALHDSAPMVYLTTKGPPREDGRPALQEVDQAAMATPVTKGVIQIESSEDLASGLQVAFSLSVSGNPGPVFVEVSKSVISAEDPPAAPTFPPRALGTLPHSALLARARDRLRAGTRVVLMVGQGAFGAGDRLRILSERLGAAVVSTSSGRGALSEDHPNLVCGDFSGWGGGLVNELVEAAGLVLALGCGFSFNGTSGYRLRIPAEKLIRVDASRNKLGEPDVAGLLIEGDVSDFVEEMLGQRAWKDSTPDGWTARELSVWKDRFREKSEESGARFPRLGKSPDGLREFFRSLRDCLPDDAIIVTDSGLHQTVTRRFFSVRAPRGMILPSDFQSMGFGLPAAIGAALAKPARRVVAVLGDGGMLMSGMEVVTAVREAVHLTVIVFSDGHLGQIRQQQIHEYGRPYATRIGNLELERFSEATMCSYIALDGEGPTPVEEILENPGVTIVELLLEDHPRLLEDRLKALAKSRLRRALGPRVINRLKRFLPRG